MELVAFLGTDTDNWGQITALINRGEWDSVVLVKSKGAPEFPQNQKTTTIEIDCNKPMLDLKDIMKEKLKSKLSGDFEVALSLASGNGKEHMALISALLNLPVGIKLAVYTKEGIQFIT